MKSLPAGLKVPARRSTSLQDCSHETDRQREAGPAALRRDSPRCSRFPSSSPPSSTAEAPPTRTPPGLQVNPPTPDPRVGLAAGMFDAGEASWNLELLSTAPPPEEFLGSFNSDLAFTGDYAIQGNFNGVQVWDISDPASPVSGGHIQLSGFAERRVGVREPPLRFRGGQQRPPWTAATRGCATRSVMSGFAGFASSTSPTSPIRSTSQTCRPAAVRTPTRCWSTRGDDENVYIYVSGSSHGAAFRGSWRAVPRSLRRRTPTRRSSASR